MLRNKLMTACCVAVLTAALYGCSSSSDDDGANMQVQDLQDQIAALEAALGEDHELTPAALEALVSDLATAEGALEVARAALEMAMDNTADEMEIDRLTKAVTAAEDMRNSYKTKLDTANAELAELKQKEADDEVAEAAKMKSEMAAEVLKALATLSGTLPGITVSASSGGDLTAKAASYTLSDTAPDAISGFRGAILTKGGAEAHVYTDIEDAVARTIGGIYSKASGGPNAPESYTVSGDGGTLELPTINWDDVTRADSSQVMTAGDPNPTTTFAGSVGGLPGTFSCTAQDCTAPTRETDGSVPDDTTATDWTFAPTDPNGTIDVADKDGYLQFGWWLNPKGKDVDDGFNVRIFADAPGMTKIAESLDGVEGSATYTGGAAGKWAIASTTEDRTDGGHFTATATLGVDFDADMNGDATDGNDKLGVSVSGMITDFMTGDVSRPDWSVALTLDDVVPDVASDPTTLGVQTADNLPPDVTGGATWSTGGAVDGTGTWEASFYGSEKVTSHPLAAEGTFNAAIAASVDGNAVGRIRGAFGATKQ